MNKLYYQALKALPDGYIDDDTRVVQLSDKKGVLAVNPFLAPIIFKDSTMEWQPIELRFEAPA